MVYHYMSTIKCTYFYVQTESFINLNLMNLLKYIESNFKNRIRGIRDP